MRDNTIVGWGPTIREVNYLARLFDEVVHIAPTFSTTAPRSSLPYEVDNVRIASVGCSPGDGAKEGSVLGRLWRYCHTLRRELRDDSWLHVRCPAGLSLIAMLVGLIKTRRKGAWIKYAGDWTAGKGEPWSYWLQRRLLRSGVTGSIVTVNGRWEGDPAFVRPFFNPCLKAEELSAARTGAQGKALLGQVKCIYVGRVEKAKGAGRAIEVIKRLADRGVDARLEIAGDGPERKAFERESRDLEVADRVTFHGWLGRDAIDALYRGAHFVLFPTMASEGWPKVLSEGMAHGALPIAGRVSSIPQYLSEFGVGRAVPAAEVNGFVTAIEKYLEDRDRWKKESEQARRFAERFTYDRYLQEVRKVFSDLKRARE